MKNMRCRIVAVVSVFILLITGCSAGGDNRSQGLHNPVSYRSHQSSKYLHFSLCYPEYIHYGQYMLALATDYNIYGCYVKDDEVLLDNIDKENYHVKETYVLYGFNSCRALYNLLKCSQMRCRISHDTNL